MKLETKIILIGLRNILSMLLGGIGAFGLAVFAFIATLGAFYAVAAPSLMLSFGTDWSFLMFSVCWVMICIPVLIAIYRIAHEKSDGVDFLDMNDFDRYIKNILQELNEKPDEWLLKFSLPVWLRMSLYGFLTGLFMSCSIICGLIPAMYIMGLMVWVVSKWFVVSLWKKCRSVEKGNSSSFMSSLSERLSSAVSPEERARMEAASLGARTSVASAEKRKPRSSL